MTDGDWVPSERRREPLPRLEDLSEAGDGYDREAVKAAFAAFYRHAADVDATLRVLETVEAFQRQAADLRADIRALRAASWGPSPSPRSASWYAGPRTSRGYAPASALSDALPRVAVETVFILLVAVGAALAGVSTPLVVLLVLGAWLIVGAAEVVIATGRPRIRRRRAELPPVPAAEPQPTMVAPPIEAERVEEEEQVAAEPEPAEAERVEPDEEIEAEPVAAEPAAAEEVPEPAPETDAPEAEEPAAPAPARRFWRRRRDEGVEAMPATGHVRVLHPAGEDESEVPSAEREPDLDADEAEPAEEAELAEVAEPPADEAGHAALAEVAEPPAEEEAVEEDTARAAESDAVGVPPDAPEAGLADEQPEAGVVAEAGSDGEAAPLAEAGAPDEPEAELMAEQPEVAVEAPAEASATEPPVPDEEHRVEGSAQAEEREQYGWPGAVGAGALDAEQDAAPAEPEDGGAAPVDPAVEDTLDEVPAPAEERFEQPETEEESPAREEDEAPVALDENAAEEPPAAESEPAPLTAEARASEPEPELEVEPEPEPEPEPELDQLLPETVEGEVDVAEETPETEPVAEPHPPAGTPREPFRLRFWRRRPAERDRELSDLARPTGHVEVVSVRPAVPPGDVKVPWEAPSIGAAAGSGPDGARRRRRKPPSTLRRGRR
jgi:hypothetical protein